MQKKVSIITSCYNGEKHLYYFLNSILNQTYKNIEFIFINDGSTDFTEKIIKSYNKKFIKRNIKFIYVYQDNQGQAVALNNALKLFTGEYLTWLDSDDLLAPKSIEKKVDFLDKNLEYGFVRTDGNIVSENNLHKRIAYLSGKKPDRFMENIIYDLIMLKNIYVANGCYMLRTSDFLKTNPSKNIYNSRSGQNWQMLLPIANNYKCGYIDEALFTYVIRKNSHSHSVNGYLLSSKHSAMLKDILINVIHSINDINHITYLKFIENKYNNLIIESTKCTRCFGCGACINICPKNAIIMKFNTEGFLYPNIELNKCDNCKLCLYVCPELGNHFKPNRIITNFGIALRSKDFSQDSTSGGIFAQFANKILLMNGFVSGAIFDDDWYVKHIVTNDINLVNKMRNSKYLQSDCGKVFKEIEILLKDNKLILFTGTPCQVAGLYGYLKKDYENLLTIDLICHGVSSPKIWNKFLKEETSINEITNIVFRNKKMNLIDPLYEVNNKHEYLTIKLNNGNELIKKWSDCSYIISFLNNLSLRYSCGNCPFCGRIRPGDITIGDFWSDEALEHRKDGISQILLNSNKGKLFFNSLENVWSIKYNINLKETSYSAPNINGYSFIHHNSRDRFFELSNIMTVEKAVDYSINNKYDIAVLCMRGYNYGNQLTTFSIYNILIKMQKSVLMLDRPLSSFDKPLSEPNSNFIENPYSKYSISEIFQDKKSMYKLNDRIETFILPSDQVLRPSYIKSFDSYTLMDWVRDDKLKIAFSSSFGEDFFEDDDNFRAEMGFYLNRFDAISVREESGIKYAKKYFNIDVEQTLDPVFLCDPDVFIEMSYIGKQIVPSEPFLGAYILDPSSFKEEIINNTIKYMNLNNYLIIPNAEKDKEKLYSWNLKTSFNIKVEEFLACILNCNIFVTDSFHGICFSIIFKKQFIIIYNDINERGKSRITDLLYKLNLEERFIETYEENKINEVLNRKIDYEKVYKILNPEIDKSLSYLNKYINNNNFTSKNKSLYDIYYKKLFDLEIKLNKKSKLSDFIIIKILFFLLIKSFKTIKCLKDNGIKYTIKLMIKRIKELFEKYLKK